MLNDTKKFTPKHVSVFIARRWSSNNVEIARASFHYVEANWSQTRKIERENASQIKNEIPLYKAIQRPLSIENPGDTVTGSII